MKEDIFRKGLVLVVIFLFVGIAFQPAISTNNTQKEEINLEQKDYLFQTIIDIANNPKVKNLLETYTQKITINDFDHRSVFIKLLHKNPRLLFSIFFTKPSFTFDYLNSTYKKGIELSKIFGEDELLNIIKSIKLTDTEPLDELTSIINDDKDLSNRLEKLSIMNNYLKPDSPLENSPIICATLWLILFAIGMPLAFSLLILDGAMKNGMLYLLAYSNVAILDTLFFITMLLMARMGCISLEP